MNDTNTTLAIIIALPFISSAVCAFMTSDINAKAGAVYGFLGGLLFAVVIAASAFL